MKPRTWQRFDALIGYGLLAIALCLTLFWSTFYIVDDAYITYRYAVNLAQHGELVFNLGERVEGITNLSWAVLLAGLHWLTNLPVHSLALPLSLLLVAYAMLRLVTIGRLLGLNTVYSVLGSLLVLLAPGFLAANTNGLEACLYSALLAEAVYRYLRKQSLLLFVVLGLLCWTRPDAIVPALLLLVLAVRERERWSRLAWGIALFAAMVGGITLFRLAYYGSPIPNSVVAKSFGLHLLWVERRQVALYVLSFVHENVLLFLVWIVAALVLLRPRALPVHRETSVQFFVVVCIGYSILVVVRNGGDWMPDYRLLLQYGVLYGVAVFCLVRQRVSRGALLVSLVVVQSLLSLAPLGLRVDQPWRVSVQQPTGYWVDVTERLAPVLEEEDVVAAEAIGYISYRLLGQRFHDPVGLMDPYVARNGYPSITFGKHDSEYTLGQVRPSVLVWQYTGHVKGLDQALLDGYTAFSPLDDNSWFTDVVMIRNDRLEAIAPAFEDWRQVRITTTEILPAP